MIMQIIISTWTLFFY